MPAATVSTPPTPLPSPFPLPYPLHDRREYELTVRQEPKQARMCGVGGKADRRPIDPPPIVQLKVRDKDKEKAKDPTGQDENSSGPGQTEYLQNPYYFMFASLAKPDDDTELHWLKDGRTRCTTGSVVSSLYHLKDPQNPNEEVGFFVFPDLSVRTEGSYRLKLSLFEVVGNSVRHCKSIFSAPFYVYTAKKFPGMEESTPLSCSLADQGIKIRIRKDIRVRKKPNQEGNMSPVPLLSAPPAPSTQSSSAAAGSTLQQLPAPSATGGVPLQPPTLGHSATNNALPHPSAPGGQPIPAEDLMGPPLQQRMVGLLPEEPDSGDENDRKKTRKRQKRSHPPRDITPLRDDASSTSPVNVPPSAPGPAPQYPGFEHAPAGQQAMTMGTPPGASVPAPPAASTAAPTTSPQGASQGTPYFDRPEGLQQSAPASSATPATPYPAGPPPPYSHPGSYGPPQPYHGMNYWPPPPHQQYPPPHPQSYPPPSHHQPPPTQGEYHPQGYYPPSPAHQPPPPHWGVPPQRYPPPGPPQHPYGEQQHYIQPPPAHQGQGSWYPSAPPPNGYPGGSYGAPPQQSYGHPPPPPGGNMYAPSGPGMPRPPQAPGAGGQHAGGSGGYYGAPPPPQQESSQVQQLDDARRGIRLPPLRTREEDADAAEDARERRRNPLRIGNIVSSSERDERM